MLLVSILSSANNDRRFPFAEVEAVSIGSAIYELRCIICFVSAGGVKRNHFSSFMKIGLGKTPSWYEYDGMRHGGRAICVIRPNLDDAVVLMYRCINHNRNSVQLMVIDNVDLRIMPEHHNADYVVIDDDSDDDNKR